MKKTVQVKPEHCPLDFFPTKKGQLYVAEKSIEQLTAIAGQTPVYIYDRQQITQRVKTLRTVLPEQIQLHYAIKANPMPAVVQHLATLVDGLDIASHGELLSALNCGMKPSEISFAGPGKSSTELGAAIAAGIVINVESENELQRIHDIGEQLGITPGIALRVNPDFELKSSGMKMSGGPKQFGIDAEKIPEVLHRLSNLSIQFEGLHIFCGSQNLRSEAIIDAHNKTFELADRLLADSPFASCRFINIGGGFGIPYFPGDTPLDIQAIADNLQLLLEQYPQFSQQQIIIELGRYLVGEAGVYISQIIDKKDSRGIHYLITDGGLNHHLSNSGNFGQVIRKNYPVRISKQRKTEDAEQKLKKVTIVGPLCTPLDTLADKMLLPDADIGDYVVILQSGAYGKTASPEHFLSHNSVKELLL